MICRKYLVGDPGQYTDRRVLAANALAPDECAAAPQYVLPELDRCMRVKLMAKFQLDLPDVSLRCLLYNLLRSVTLFLVFINKSYYVFNLSDQTIFNLSVNRFA